MRTAVCTFYITFAMFILSVASGCKTTGLTKEQQLKQFEKMKWIEGYWQNISPEATIIETWIRGNDTLLLGKSTMIFGSDTLYKEDIKLAPSGTNIYYSIISRNVDKTGKSSYILIKNQGGVLVFEDPGNKEQSRISYLRKSKDNVVLKVEGMDGDKVTVEKYSLVRAVK